MKSLSLVTHAVSCELLTEETKAIDVFEWGEMIKNMQTDKSPQVSNYVQHW